MRRQFADTIYTMMKENPDIWVISGDLGYKMWDRVKSDFPRRFINTGAAETTMMGIAVGLALEGKIPFVYSATTFLLYRAFEVLRNYVNREIIPVKLVGSGRDKDYLHDGFSHWAHDAKGVLSLFPNIKTLWPDKKEQITDMVELMITDTKPYFISLRR